MKIICFPYAGSHIRVFSPLHDYLKKKGITADFSEIDYAGHGKRYSEKLIGSIQDNAADVFNSLLFELSNEEPVILIGYSMGALIAYETAKLMLEHGMYVSKLFFMAAIPPHRIAVSNEKYEGEEAFLKKCQTYGLIKEDQFKSKELRKIFLPALLNDILSVDNYNLSNKFQWTKFDQKIDIAVFHGELDETVSYTEDWKDLSAGEIEYYTYSAGHFFYYDCQKELFSDIYTALNGKSLNITTTDRRRNADGKFIVTTEAEFSGKF